MSSLDGIQPISFGVPELRPELDRASLQPYQLAQFYTLQEQRMVTPIAYRDGGDRMETIDPLLYDAASRRVEPPREVREPEPVSRTEDVPPDRMEAASSVRRLDARGGDVSPASDSGRADDSDQRVMGIDKDATADKAPASPATLPYGADAARIRHLVDTIVDGREFVPLTFHYREAGDLIPVKPGGQGGTPASLRPVSSVYRSP